jgi:hypothetical protein
VNPSLTAKVRFIGFGVAPADLDGPVVCRMFNRAIAKQTPPKYLSSDNDPLFRFQRGRLIVKRRASSASGCAATPHKPYLTNT